MANRQQIIRAIRRSSVVAFGAVLFAISVSPAVLAQSGRPDTRKLSCAQAQSIVKQRGSVVMTTGPRTYDRFVADARFCSPDARMVRPKFAPTRDNPECAVGNRCFKGRNFRN